MSGLTWPPKFDVKRDEPTNDRVETLWRVKGKYDRVWECALYQVATGLELRVQREGSEDPVQTQLVHTRTDVEVFSERWRATLVAQGFTPLEPVAD